MITTDALITGPRVMATAPVLRELAEAERIAIALDASRVRAGVETDLQAAMYLAQLAFESAGFRALVEPSGAAYEGRDDLGNTQPGDGERYRGRGFIQLTGRTNYAAASAAIGIDILSRPELASGLACAAAVAAWYWSSRRLADAKHVDDIEWVTRRINGGLNGLEIRRRYYQRARRAFGLPVEEENA